MLTRRQALQIIAVTTALGSSTQLWAEALKSRFLKPGEKLEPGEFVWQPELSPEGPVAILVSLPDQLAHVFRNGIEIGVTTISSGKPGHLTPTGVFLILQKDKHHHSSIYNNASMPNTQRLTWGGVCLHAGGLPGYPSSHGCVHLPLDFSAKLFEITHLSTPVIVANDSSAPEDIVHPGIVLNDDAKQMIADKIAEENAKKHKKVPSASGADPKRVAVVSLLISGSDQKSYLLVDGNLVDQKPVDISSPQQPLGTHVLVLKSLHGTKPSWSSVAILHAESSGKIQATDAETLDRIHFDPEFAEQVLRNMHPGMTMMITDLPADADTRSEQDFVIMTSEFVQS